MISKFIHFWVFLSLPILFIWFSVVLIPIYILLTILADGFGGLRFIKTDVLNSLKAYENMLNVCVKKLGLWKKKHDRHA